MFILRKRLLFEEYSKEFQKLIDEGNFYVCKNDITENSFKSYREEVSKLIPSYKKDFENDSSAFLSYISLALDTITIDNNQEEPKPDRKEQVTKFINALKCIQEYTITNIQLIESRIQTYISLFAVVAAIIIPCILNCCSHTIDKEQYETLIKTIQDNCSTHLVQQDSISHPLKK